MTNKIASFPDDIDSVDVEVIKCVRPNLLLCGPADAVNTTLTTLRPSLQQPVYKWVGDAGGSLPDESAAR